MSSMIEKQRRQRQAVSAKTTIRQQRCFAKRKRRGRLSQRCLSYKVTARPISLPSSSTSSTRGSLPFPLPFSVCSTCSR